MVRACSGERRVEKLNRPTTPPFGVTDWEAFFEADPGGVIPLVMQVRSRDALMRCAVVVVENLFTRKDDDERRHAFLRIIGETIGAPSSDPEAWDAVRQRVILVFRHIKDERKAKAEAFVKAKEAEAKASEARAREAEERRLATDALEFDGPPPAAPTPAPTVDLEAPPADPALEHDVEALFARVLWDVIRERFQVLRGGSTAREQERVVKPVPFFLSEAFVDHFGRLVVGHVASRVAENTRSVVRPAEALPPEARTAFIREQIDEYRNRRAIWESWKMAWATATRQQPLPAKPKGEEKQGGLMGLLKKRPATPSWRKEMTLEEWENAVAEIKRANEAAAKLWAEMTCPSDAYAPPLEEDNEFLMEMFGRSPKAIAEHMNALRQIAGQGGEVGRAFDTWRKNKNPDLAVVACCVRFPDLFIGGRSPLLKRLVSAYSPDDLRRAMPFTVRYFGEILGVPA